MRVVGDCGCRVYQCAVYVVMLYGVMWCEVYGMYAYGVVDYVGVSWRDCVVCVVGVSVVALFYIPY